MFIFVKMDFALINLQWLICYIAQTNKQTNKTIWLRWSRPGTLKNLEYLYCNYSQVHFDSECLFIVSFKVKSGSIFLLGIIIIITE